MGVYAPPPKKNNCFLIAVIQNASFNVYHFEVTYCVLIENWFVFHYTFYISLGQKYEAETHSIK